MDDQISAYERLEEAYRRLEAERDGLLTALDEARAERDDLKADVAHADLQVRYLMDQRSERLCQIMPGDRVMCLDTSEGMKLLAGVVEQVRIPGPMHPDKTVKVLLDDDGYPGWWEHSQVEPFRG